jgi:hypothetical protein
LNRAYSAVDDLSVALDNGHDAAAQSIARSAFEAVGRVTGAVETLSAERPPEARMSEADAVGSAIAIGGSEVATAALDMMVNAMVALTTTDDEGDTDFLIGACVDAASAYQAGAAVVQAAPGTDGPAMMDLKQVLEAEGGAAVSQRVNDARPRVLEINARIGAEVGGRL